MKIVLAVAALIGSSVSAQTPSGTAQPTRGTSMLTGVVVDSVRGGFLKGASVAVLGPSRMGLTDSLGRFSIDGIPPGSHRVTLMDDLLDSLSLSVVSAPTEFAAGDTVALILAIPSQSTIFAAKCGAAPGEGEQAALFGRVSLERTSRSSQSFGGGPGRRVGQLPGNVR